jgi:hypothetical protein
MVDWDKFDERQREIFQEEQAIGDMKRSLFEFPASDPTQLLQKPMNPTDTFGGIISRDITTSNFNPAEAKDVSILLTSAVVLNEARELFDIKNDKDADKWLKATVTNIKASIHSKSAVSKGFGGWLGELFVTLKRKGEIATQFVKQKGGVLK